MTIQEQKHDIQGLGERIKKLDASLKALAGSGDQKAAGASGEDLADLIRIIHQPGWTTPAEFILVSGLVDSLLSQTEALAAHKKILMAGGRAVSAK